jgi:hypothetical protein
MNEPNPSGARFYVPLLVRVRETKLKSVGLLC